MVMTNINRDHTRTKAKNHIQVDIQKKSTTLNHEIDNTSIPTHT